MDQNSKIFNRSISDNQINSTLTSNLLLERDFAKDLPDPTRFFKNKSGKPDFSDIKGKCKNGKCDFKNSKPKDDTNKISLIKLDNANNLQINDKLLNDRNFGLSKDHKINNNIFTNSIIKLNKQTDRKQLLHYTNINNILSLKFLVYNQYYYNDFFYSSYGLLSLLITYYIGTNEETKKEITKSLNLKDKNSIYNSLLNLNVELAKSDSVNVANCIFINDKYNITKKYKEFILKVAIYDKINILNFMDEYDKINSYVLTNTQNMIKKTIKPTMFNLLTKSILVNAIYFKSDWKIPFNKKDTLDEIFYSNKNVKCKMMNLYNKDLMYYETQDYQLLELDYEDENYVFGIWLPRKIEQISIIRSTTELLDNINYLYKVKVNVKLPKFTKEMTFDVIPFFKFLGINKCFTNTAQTNSMSKDNSIPISLFIHTAKIEVSDKQIVSNIRESVIENETSQKNFYANRPFIYYVRHVKTNSILLMGKYNNK